MTYSPELNTKEKLVFVHLWCGFCSLSIHTSVIFSGIFWLFLWCLPHKCVCWWPGCDSSVFPLCCSTGGASHVWLTWPKCEAGTCTFSQDVHMSVGCVHILSSGAETYGHGAGGGERVLIAGMDKVKNPFWKCHTHPGREKVCAQVCEQCVLL